MIDMIGSNFSKKLRWVLLAIMIMALVIVLWVFWDSRNMHQNSVDNSVSAPEKSGLTIGKVQHTATRNGVTEWSLEADSAEYVNENRQAILHGLLVTFFLKNNEKALLSADKGVLETDTFDIKVSGNVVMKNEGYRIETQELSYFHGKKTIYSNSPIKIAGNSFSLTADKLNLDLNTNKTTLKGHVRGNFDENFQL